MPSLSKLRNVIAKMPAPAKASVCFAICALLQKGVLFLTTPIFTRLLTPDQYGLFSLYSSWLSIVTVICTLNLNYNVFFRGILEFPKAKNAFTSSMQGMVTLVTLLLFSTYLVFPGVWTAVTGLNGELIFCMFLEMLFAPAWYFWLSKQRAEYKYIAASLTTVLALFISTLLAVVAVLFTQYGVLARVYPVVLIDVSLGAFFYVLNLARGKKLFDRKFWSYALAFNLPLLPHYLSDVLLAQVDRVMIGDICGPTFVAIYSVAYAVAMIVALVNSSVNASLVPWIYKKLENGGADAIDALSRIGTVLSVVIATLSCFAITIGPELIAILGPAEYQPAVQIMPPVGLSVLFMFYVSLFINVETYYGKNKYVALVSCLAAIINIGLNAMLIPLFGFVAAGWTTLICYALMAFGHFFFMRKVRQQQGLNSPVYNYKFLVVLAVASFAFGLMMLFVYDYPYVRYLILVCIAVASFANRSKIRDAYRELRQR